MKRERLRRYRQKITRESLRVPLNSDERERMDAFAESIGLDLLYEKMKEEDLLTREGYEAFMERNRKIDDSSEDNQPEKENNKIGVLRSVAETIALAEQISKSKSDKNALRTVIDHRTDTFPKGCNVAARIILKGRLLVR